MSTVTYKEAKDNLERIWNETLSTREPVVVKRRGRESLALLPAGELSSLLETAHLLRSPANARRLVASLRNVRRGRYEVVTMAGLRRKVGLNGTRD